jgi:MFS transporter, SET family, sugar efflux transporter
MTAAEPFLDDPTGLALPSDSGQPSVSLFGAIRTVLRHRGIVRLLGCCLLLGLANSFAVPFMSMFGTIEVKMNPVVFGVFMTVTSLSAIGISTALAHWSDTRYSRRSMLVLGSVCGILGYVGYAFVRDVLWLTVIGSILVGISTIGFSQIFAHARELLAASGIPERDAPLYMNVFRLFFALAWTVGPAVASWVIVRYSYRGTFLVTAFVFFLLLLAILRWVPGVPPAPPDPSGAQTTLGKMLMRPDLMAYFVAFVLIFTSTTMAMMGLPLLVLKTLGGNARHVGILFSLAPVFELPLMFFFGLLASRGDQARLIRIAVGIAVVYFALLMFVQAPWHIYPLQILSAAITAVVSGVAITFFQNYMPGQAGTATNHYYNAFRVGCTSGYLLFGIVAAGFGYRAVFLVCASLCVITMGILFWAKERTVQMQAMEAEG